jgi:hypothetical protein
MYNEKPHTLASAAETGYLQFKEQVPFQFENKISAVQCKMKAIFIQLLTPLELRWTILLTPHILFECKFDFSEILRFEGYCKELPY